jgi:hypothetical protein
MKTTLKSVFDANLTPQMRGHFPQFKYQPWNLGITAFCLQERERGEVPAS